MTKQELDTILSKLTTKEQQQVICLVKLNEAVIDFIHKDETEEFKANKLDYEQMIILSATRLAETQDIEMLSNINYANNKLSELTGYSNCLADLSVELFPIYEKYNKE